MSEFVHTSHYDHCMCVQPAVDAVQICYRFHAAIHCLAVNISRAESKQATAEIQQQYVFVTRKQSGFSAGPELICCE